MRVSYEDEKNIYLDEENKIKPIFENVSITDLMKDQYNNSIIIQNEDNYKNDRFNLLQEIMKQHNYIPTKIKHKKHAITRIIFEKDKRNIILTIDLNQIDHRELNYKDLIILCNTHKLNSEIKLLARQSRK